MSNFKIEKSIPVPPQVRQHSNKRYPFNQMEVGDSFHVPFDDHSEMAVFGAVTRARRKTGFVLVTRKEGNGTRVWRVA